MGESELRARETENRKILQDFHERNQEALEEMKSLKNSS